MKPTGLSLSVGAGGPSMRVRTPTRTEDAIWSAVQEAVMEGWEPKQFICEVEQAWKQALRDDMDVAMRQFP